MSEYHDELSGESDRAVTALMWLADLFSKTTGKLSAEKWRARAMRYANELHDHIDKRDKMTVSQFDKKREELDAEYKKLSQRWKRLERVGG
jgi:hemerythrin-like domain-containing protein